MRNLSLDLRPAMLDDLGLLPAVLWLVENYTSRTQMKVDFRHAGLADREFSPDVSTAAYRIIQEGLTNVARHSEATQVTVRAWAGLKVLFVQIEDKGCGFDPAAVPPTSAGLRGMRERASLLGGSLSIESGPGEGTCVTAELPIPAPPRKKKAATSPA